MAENSRKVLGHAVYVELLSKDKKGIAQILLTPEAQLSDGRLVGTARLFRILRAFQTRGNWSIGLHMDLHNKLRQVQEQGHFSTLFPFPSEDEFRRGHNVSNEIRDFLYHNMMTEGHIKYINSFLESPHTNWVWEFSGDPFVVPVTEGDLKQIYHRLTPQNLINRIKKIREAKGFPERKKPGGGWWIYAHPTASAVEESVLA